MNAMKLLSIFAICVNSSTKVSRFNSYAPQQLNETKITKGTSFVQRKIQPNVIDDPTILEKQALGLSCGAHAIDNLFQIPGLLFDNAKMLLEHRVSILRPTLPRHALAHQMSDTDLWKEMYADGINSNYDFYFIEWIVEYFCNMLGVTFRGTLNVSDTPFADYETYVWTIMGFLDQTNGVLIWTSNKKSNAGHFYTIRKIGNYWYLLDSMNPNPIKYDNVFDLIIEVMTPLYNGRFRNNTRMIGVDGVLERTKPRQDQSVNDLLSSILNKIL